MALSPGPPHRDRHDLWHPGRVTDPDIEVDGEVVQRNGSFVFEEQFQG